jgi:hypothetical protein
MSVTAATVSASVATATVGHRRDDYRHHDNRRRCDLRRRRDANRASLPGRPSRDLDGMRTRTNRIRARASRRDRSNNSFRRR